MVCSTGNHGCEIMKRWFEIIMNQAHRMGTREEYICKGDTVLLNDSVITSYRFRKNYYFVAGDRGENSQDSRYWGSASGGVYSWSGFEDMEIEGQLYGRYLLGQGMEED